MRCSERRHRVTAAIDAPVAAVAELGRSIVMNTLRLLMKRWNLLITILLLGSLSLLAQLPDSSAFSVVPGDVTEAKIVRDPAGGLFLRVTLTPAKRAGFAAFTENNINRQIKIVVNGRLRSRPYVRESPTDQRNIHFLFESRGNKPSLLGQRQTFPKAERALATANRRLRTMEGATGELAAGADLVSAAVRAGH